MGRLNKAYLVNICFASPSKTVFLGLGFYYCMKDHKLDDGFTFIWKKIRCHIFLFLCHILLFGSSDWNCEFIRREYGFSINSKISSMNSGDKPILTLKISVTKFCRFRYFADLILELYFYAKIVRVNSLLLSWVLCILNLY